MVTRVPQGIFDIISERERKLIHRAFYCLERDQINEAIQQFQDLVSGNFSGYCQSFANYGLGVAYSKIEGNKRPASLENIHTSIQYLEASLKTLEHSDAHLMLGTALRKKIVYHLAYEPKTMLDYEGLLTLVNKAIKEFQRAAELNKKYQPTSQEEIDHLRRERHCLEEKIKDSALKN